MFASRRGSPGAHQGGESRAEALRAVTTPTLVLHGDSTDEELLTDENVHDMDLFIALTS